MTSILLRYQRSFQGLPPAVWSLALVMLVNRSGAMVIPFLSLYLAHEMGWGELFAGKSIAVYGAGACVGAYLGGRLAACIGAQRVQQYSLLGNAIGLCVLSMMDTKASILVTLFCLSVVSEAFRPANVTAICESVPDHLQRRAFALNRMAINLGFTLGPAIGGVLAGISYSMLFYVDAASCIGAAFVLIRSKHLGRCHKARPAEVHNVLDNADGMTLVRPFHFAAFLGLSLLVFLIFFQLMSTYPIYLRNQLGMLEWQIGSLMSINTLMIVAFEMVLVESMQKYQSLSVMALGVFILCEGFALLSVGGGAGIAIAALVVWTIGEMMVMPVMMTFVAQSCKPNHRSRRIGVYSTTLSVAFVLAPLLGAWCYSIYPAFIWWLAALIGPIASLGLLQLRFEIDRGCGVNEPSVVQSREQAIRELRVDMIDPHV
ncbi:MFS transporter [Rubripirellula amarantea]|nr:MFS transporter [Rubripirellula amarantea]